MHVDFIHVVMALSALVVLAMIGQIIMRPPIHRTLPDD